MSFAFLYVKEKSNFSFMDNPDIGQATVSVPLYHLCILSCYDLDSLLGRDDSSPIPDRLLWAWGWQLGNPPSATDEGQCEK